ncbi:hypothetical protein NC652_006295 [Populus alba x Populus x berolinensis]|nr:hypothetical protein NC652_006295 [Populus alba x Populus x berolinensis]
MPNKRGQQKKVRYEITGKARWLEKDNNNSCISLRQAVDKMLYLLHAYEKERDLELELPNKKLKVNERKKRSSSSSEGKEWESS